MQILELKIPPLALVVIFALGMWGAPPIASLPPSGLFMQVATFALALLGVAICVAGVVSFRLARTTVNPTTPDAASTLVVAGIYRHTRNPMYLGFLVMLLAWGLWLASLSALLLLPLFALYLTRFQIMPEEKALLARFGQDFKSYTQQVRRWV